MSEINEQGEIIGAYIQPERNYNLYRESTSIPEEIKRWNWGAFLISWIWAIGNNVWIGLLVFLPYVGFIITALWLIFLLLSISFSG